MKGWLQSFRNCTMVFINALAPPLPCFPFSEPSVNNTPLLCICLKTNIQHLSYKLSIWVITSYLILGGGLQDESRLWCDRNVGRMDMTRIACRIWQGNFLENSRFGSLKRWWEDSIQMDLEEIEYEGKKIQLAQYYGQWLALVLKTLNLCILWPQN